MPATLERIRISGFKSIRELDLELRPLNVLVGANGSGKSNFIGVFHLLNQILQERLQLYTAKVGVESLLHYGRKTTDKVSISLQFAGYHYGISLVPTERDTLFVASEGSSYETPAGIVITPPAATIGRNTGYPESRLLSSTSSDENGSLGKDIRGFLQGWQVYHIHDTSSEARMRGFQNLHDNVRLHSDGSNIAAFLYLIKEKFPDEYSRIVRLVRRVAPFFHDFVLRPNPLNEDQIRLQWVDVHSDTVYNAHLFSDGTLRFICLATLLMQPEEYLPSVILIDEPELGLHPFATSLLAGMLRSVSTYRQIIVATQSVQFVNQFAPEDIIVVEREDGQSTFRRLDAEGLEDWMEDYGVGDLWEKNVFGGRPKPERA